LEYFNVAMSLQQAERLADLWSKRETALAAHGRCVPGSINAVNYAVAVTVITEQLENLHQRLFCRDH
jgi:hypothetical protein